MARGPGFSARGRLRGGALGSSEKSVRLGRCGGGENPSRGPIKTRHGREEFPDENVRKRESWMS